ncbi:MAG: HNH endonuclease [Luteitalea sp.]|nr:HNH endonuclease [Luteitalea sp.]
MTRYVSEALRGFVAARAGYRCEYCLIREEDTFFGCEVDHIVAVKHGGLAQQENLANACLVCNRNKGSDLGSVSAPSGQFTRFFNPRIDRWRDYFQLDRLVIKALTDIGDVTVRIFRFNDDERLLERQALVAAGTYPGPPVT